jgi:septal ring factor EnvC (AmiA/AmiB activator)
MSLKERVQGNLIVFFLATTVASFAAGWEAYNKVQERFEAISSQKRSELGQDLDRLQKQLDERNQEKLRVEQALQQLQTQLDKKDPQKSELKQALEQLQSQLGERNQENLNLEQRQQQLQKQLDERNEENRKLERARQQLQTRLDESAKQVADLEARLESIHNGSTPTPDVSQARQSVRIRLDGPTGEAPELIKQLKAGCLSEAPFSLSTEQDAYTLTWDIGSNYYDLNVLGGSRNEGLWTSGKLYMSDLRGNMKTVIEEVCTGLKRRFK